MKKLLGYKIGLGSIKALLYSSVIIIRLIIRASSAIIEIRPKTKMDTAITVPMITAFIKAQEVFSAAETADAIAFAKLLKNAATTFTSFVLLTSDQSAKVVELTLHQLFKNVNALILLSDFFEFLNKQDTKIY